MMDKVDADRQYRKVTKEKVIRLRREHELEGKGSAFLGKKYEIAPRTVRQILNRETWRHV